MRSTPLALAAALLLAAAPSLAADFHDRDALAAILTLDEQAPLADAEEDLADAEADLADAEAARDAAQANLNAANMQLADAQTLLESAEMTQSQAQMDLEAANTALEQGILDGLPQDQIDLLEQAVIDAQGDLEDADTAVGTAQTAVADALVAVDTAQMALDGAQDAVDTAQMAVDEAQAVVQAILDEIEGTEAFVAALDEDDVFALNRSIHPAVVTDLVPLDIDLDLLTRITDEDLGDREIQALTRGFRLQERFHRKADAFEEDGMTAQADRFRAKGDEMLEKNLAMVDGPPGKNGVTAAQGAAKNAAGDAATAAANEVATDVAQAAAGEAAAEIAKQTPGRAAGDAAREIAKQNGQGRN